jgi:hypothetical protein
VSAQNEVAGQAMGGRRRLRPASNEPSARSPAPKSAEAETPTPVAGSVTAGSGVGSVVDAERSVGSSPPVEPSTVVFGPGVVSTVVVGVTVVGVVVVVGTTVGVVVTMTIGSEGKGSCEVSLPDEWLMVTVCCGGSTALYSSPLPWFADPAFNQIPVMTLPTHKVLEPSRV